MQLLIASSSGNIKKVISRAALAQSTANALPCVNKKAADPDGCFGTSGTQASALRIKALPGTAVVAEPHRQSASQHRVPSWGLLSLLESDPSVWGMKILGGPSSKDRCIHCTGMEQMDTAPVHFCPSEPYSCQGTCL